MLIGPRRWTTQSRYRRRINGRLYAFVLTGDSVVVFQRGTSSFGPCWYLVHNFKENA